MPKVTRKAVRFVLPVACVSLFSLSLFAHQYPFEPEQDKVRKIFSADNYQWKIGVNALLRATYERQNVYSSDIHRQGARNSQDYHQDFCAAELELDPVDPPNNNSRIRKLGNYAAVNVSGFLLVKILRLKCSWRNSDGEVNFVARHGQPSAVDISPENPGDSNATRRLQFQADKFSQWNADNYVLFVDTRANTRFLTYQGDYEEGAVSVDTGLFSGAFLNFAIPEGKGQKEEQWIQDIGALQIPQPLFMSSDPKYGPQRAPDPVDVAPVKLTRMAGGLARISSRQKYQWVDAVHNSEGNEQVEASFIFAPETDYGFVHVSQWNAAYQWTRHVNQNEFWAFERTIKNNMHLEFLRYE